MAYVVAPLIDVGTAPSINDILGSNGDSRILDKIRNDWGSNGVIFGSVGDPFADRFRNFTSVVTNVIRDTTEKIQKSVGYLLCTNKIRSIVNEDDLYAVPAVMRPYILNHEPIRCRLFDETIYGWGIDPNSLPKEDVAGRLISNGLVEPIYKATGRAEYQEVIEYSFKDSDPELTSDELVMIDDSRKFICRFIEEQLSPGNDKIDPTGISEGYTIGKLI